MDKIVIKNLQVFARHGVYPEEKKNGQNFYVNAALYTDVRRAGQEDRLDLSTDYGEVCGLISSWMSEHTYSLIEAAAEHTAMEILLKFPLVNRVNLEICKPQAPIPFPFENVSVSITRGWKKAYLGIGSNMGDREFYLRSALDKMKEEPKIKNLRVSEMIETKPYGVEEQSDFLNAAAAIETLFSPRELLSFLNRLEKEAGRKRELRWGPRTLDLDILLYEDCVIEEEDLHIPHRDMQNRMFVLEPLSQLAPDRVHPVLGKSIGQMRAELTDTGKLY